MLKSIIVEGCDSLGKDTLISGIKNQLGFFQEIHYQKPEVLDIYLKQARSILGVSDDQSNEIMSIAQRYYQQQSFIDMMHLLSTNVRFIMNRGHIGEVVYSSRYRNYNGKYVFDLERTFSKDSGSFLDTTLLVLLHTSSFKFIIDDGKSHNFSKKEEEQKDFIKAFNRSLIKHKLLIDVNDGGSFMQREKILDLATKAFLQEESQDD